MVQKSGINSPVEVGIISLSHYLQGLENIPGGCLGFLNHQQYHSHFICKIIMFQGLFEPPQLPTETEVVRVHQSDGVSFSICARVERGVMKLLRTKGAAYLATSEVSRKSCVRNRKASRILKTTFNLVASIFVHVTCFLFLKLLEFDKSTPTVLSWISNKTILQHPVITVPYQPKWPNGRLTQDLVTIVFRPLVAGRQNLRKKRTTRGENPSQRYRFKRKFHVTFKSDFFFCRVYPNVSHHFFIRIGLGSNRRGVFFVFGKAQNLIQKRRK